MDSNSARKILGLAEGFTLEELQGAYMAKTKTAHKNGQSDDLQQEFNVARDVLSEEIESSRVLVPLLTRELVKISEQQELVSKRREAKEELFDSMSLIKNRVISRLNAHRDFASLFSAISAGATFLKDDIAQITAIFPAFTGGALVFVSATFAFFAFMAHRSAKRVEAQTAELNKILTRQRSIDRVLDAVFSADGVLGERQFEQRLIEIMQGETGLRHLPDRSDLKVRVSNVYRDIGLLPQRLDRLMSEGFIEDYVDFLIKSEFVTTTKSAEQGFLFSRNKL